MGTFAECRNFFKLWILLIIVLGSMMSAVVYANDGSDRWMVFNQNSYWKMSLDTQTIKYDEERDIVTYWTKYERSVNRNGVYVPTQLNHEMIDFKNRTVTKIGESKYINGSPNAETTDFEAPEGVTFNLFPGDTLTDMVSRICGRQPLYAKPLWKVIYTQGQWDKYSIDLNNIEVDKLNHRALVYVLIGNSNHCSYICDFDKGTISGRDAYDRYWGREKIPVPESYLEAVYNEAYRQYEAQLSREI
ncbi:hypothetical protein I3700191H1_22740 [Megasphaera massiliensis]|uniref:hypothetical protein n=1 Tax=Megasphaera massiliensis TaxID=1232428 RepID=UPI0034C21734